MDVINSFTGKYRFLSNFWPCDVEMDGFKYKSVEAAYQASKTDIPALRTPFTNLSPSGAKQLGKKLKLRPNWNQVKLVVMHKLLIQKFWPPTQVDRTELGTLLAETYPKELIEGNYWGDTFWGVSSGVGENHLGKLLMALRDHLL